MEDNLDDFLLSLDAFFVFDLQKETLRVLQKDKVGDAMSSLHSLRSHLKRMSVLGKVHRAEIVDANGIVIVSTGRDREGVSVAEAISFQKGLISKGVFDILPEEGVLYVHTSAPLYGTSGETFAVIMLQTNARGVLAITGEYTGLGNTGETKYIFWRPYALTRI